jgi:hypothetical protein
MLQRRAKRRPGACEVSLSIVSCFSGFCSGRCGFWLGAHICAILVFADGVWFATHVQLAALISRRVQKGRQSRLGAEALATEPIGAVRQSWLLADGTLVVGALLAYLGYPAYLPVFYLGLVLLFLGNVGVHMVPWFPQGQAQRGP